MKSILLNKFVALGAVVLVLLWGLVQISDVVMQRQFQRHNAVQSVAQSMAGSQTLLGPLLHTTCTEEWQAKTNKEDKDGKPYSVTTNHRRDFVLMAMPSALDFAGDGTLSARSRGLHSTQVFNLQTALHARWNNLSALEPKAEHEGSRLQCAAPVLMLAVSDARGIRQVSLKINAQDAVVQSGTLLDHYPRGVHSVLPKGSNLAQPLTVDVNLELMGTEHFGLIPLADANSITLKTNWPHPSFNGQFLPVQHQISSAGFEAQWRVSSLASTAQADVRARLRACGVATQVMGDDDNAISTPRENGCAEMLGVTFIDPTNTYALSNRATKYGLLFIVLTFTAVGLFEIMRALRVHPVQYFLVGAGISVFFLLLVSLSEHLPFAYAYACAAAACVVLLAYYASHILGSFKRGLPFGAGIATLYGLLYVLLRMEQKALVVGAIALFVVLALVMTLTRKVNWYERLALNLPKVGRSANGEQT